MDTEKFNAKALGNNIQVARGTLKLKRKDLADIVDVSTCTMASIEGGSTDITVKRLFQIADALETSVPKLLNMEAFPIALIIYRNTLRYKELAIPAWKPTANGCRKSAKDLFFLKN